VHSFSRFFRDSFQFEMHRRTLEKNDVALISITQAVCRLVGTKLGSVHCGSNGWVSTAFSMTRVSVCSKWITLANYWGAE
jgi:hypothetical protein